MSFLEKIKDTLPYVENESEESEPEDDSAISHVANESESGSSIYDQGS